MTLGSAKVKSLGYLFHANSTSLGYEPDWQKLLKTQFFLSIKSEVYTTHNALYN